MHVFLWRTKFSYVDILVFICSWFNFKYHTIGWEISQTSCICWIRFCYVFSTCLRDDIHVKQFWFKNFESDFEYCLFCSLCSLPRKSVLKCFDLSFLFIDFHKIGLPVLFCLWMFNCCIYQSFIRFDRASDTRYSEALMLKSFKLLNKS